MNKYIFFLILPLLIVYKSNAFENIITGTVNQNEIKLALKNASNNNSVLHSGFKNIESNIEVYSVKFEEIIFKELKDEELPKQIDSLNITTSINLNYSLLTERKKVILRYDFFPIRVNPTSGKYEIVSSYKLKYNYKAKKRTAKLSNRYRENSLLSVGNWYKIKIKNTGAYKLTYNQLKNLGITNPENVRLYSYGGKQLPYYNNKANYDDLNEIPIKINKGTDGIFNNEDILIFYVNGNVNWEYNSDYDIFEHSMHSYSDYAYVMLTDNYGPGLRVSTIEQSSLEASYTSDEFDSFRYHEKNENNLVKMGRMWYGEEFTQGDEQTFSFSFPNINLNEVVKIRTNIAGIRKKGTDNTSFTIKNKNTTLGNISIGEQGKYIYARDYSRSFTINPTSNKIDILFLFNSQSSSNKGYLNYVCLNAREKTTYNNQQLIFRDTRSVGNNRITEFKITSSNKNIIIWDITDPQEPKEQNLSISGNIIKFKTSTDTLKEFIVFNTNSLLDPITDGNNTGKVDNQNLHGIGNQDMVIITHPKFKKQAETLAEIHRTEDLLKVYVTTPEKIYNEFSGGTQDISAFRNFLRMLYDKSDNEETLPKYLLLFGDGSYDNRESNSNNFIPTYQSINSLDKAANIVTDDFFGLLDDNEGEYIGALDIGIGRFTVQTTEQAQLMIDKIVNYKKTESRGEWLNQICLIGDDDDGNIHSKQADEISKYIKTNDSNYNTNKVYVDAFKKISFPTGRKAPGANKAIKEQIEQGAFIVTYVGHANYNKLTHEEIVTIDDVRNWTNINKLSIFITAGCEVAPFDDHTYTSIGELLLLNPKGGGIAALTTTRVVNGPSNHSLNKQFFEHFFDTKNTFGDIMRISKNNVPSSITKNTRKFILLGDPALKPAIPNNRAFISKVNDSILSPNIQIVVDTLKALEKASVSGYIIDTAGNLVAEDGTLFLTIFDKPTKLNTYGQDNSSFNFELQNSILFKGKASINQGFFSSEFILPKDINYSFGNGKISLYASLNNKNASGYSSQIAIGGNNEDAEDDYNGPEINMFINDTNFVDGGKTHENPILLAHISDEFGINTTGNGFGHNITAMLDGNQDNIYTLNKFYSGNLNKYNSGIIEYPFFHLSPGKHKVELKVWDIYNNSTTKSITFNVNKKNDIIIDNLKNIPNPFSDYTNFTFEHNQSGNILKIKLKIYDIKGNLLVNKELSELQEGFRNVSILWDGSADSGAKLANGFYIYNIELELQDGTKTKKSSKLMIFR